MIYLDHHAATPVCAAAQVAMQEARDRAWANPHSVHAAGRASRALLEQARDRVARALGADSADLVLTSGGTEAIHRGLLGLVDPEIRRVVTSCLEHPAVARTVEALARGGRTIVRLPAPGGRLPTPGEAELRLGPDTLVALQWVNHETGSILPIEAWAEAAAERGAPIFVDATQALGKLRVDLDAVPVTSLAVASHKIGGPAGAGAVFQRRGVRFASLAGRGGGQERGRRPGTPDVLHLVGFGAACDEVDGRVAGMPHTARLRDLLQDRLERLGFVINGAEVERVATAVSASHPDWEGAVLVAALDVEGVCASSGAACSSGLAEPSEVLRAMYPSAPWRAAGALRLSLGPEVDVRVAAAAAEAVERVVGRANPP